MSTFVQDGYNDDSTGSSVPTIAVALTGVAAGNLIAVWAKHEGAPTTITVSDGTTTLTAGTYQSNPGGDSHGQWHYLLSANSGNKTYTATFGANRAFPSIIVFEYSAIGVWSFLDQATANGTSTAPNSGNFTTSGADGVAFGGYAENSTTFTSSELVNGAAADGSKRTAAGGDPRNYTVAWRKAFSAGYTGAASATLGSSVAWVCAGIAFGASAPAPSKTSSQRRLGLGRGPFSYRRLAHGRRLVFKAPPAVFTAQPTEQTAADGSTATFSATVTGATSYQWETKAPGGGAWGNVSGGSGATTDSYTTGTLSRASDAGRLYRLKATNAGGDTYSDEVLLRVTQVPTSYATSVGLVVGSSLSFVGASYVGSNDAAAGPTTHSTTGVLEAGGAATSGAATRFRAFGSSGALEAGGATAAAASSRFRAFGTSGVIASGGAVTSGSASRFRTFGSAGALEAAGAAVAGATNRFRAFGSSGALIGGDAATTGSSNRFRAFGTSGDLIADAAIVAGAASRSGGATTHETSGALAADGAIVVGAAQHIAVHGSSGAMVADGASTTGAANRFRAFGSSGALTASGASVNGSANRFREFSTSGALVADGSAAAGTAARFRAFGTSGVLVADGSAATGVAQRSGSAITHSTSGILVADGASLVGVAFGAAVPTPIAGGGGHKRKQPRWSKAPPEMRQEIRRPVTTPAPTPDPFLAMLKREDDDLVKLVRKMYADGEFEPRKE